MLPVLRHFSCLETSFHVCYMADCSMYLRDDDVYEGVETLNLELDLSPQDPRVQIDPNRKKATIYIHDSEDG